MKDGPNIVNIAALVGDHARTSMLTALLAGQALTATELAAEANITKQTASSHLARLLDAGLISVTRQGRHKYFKLAAPDVAQLLESLMGIAQRTGATRVRPGPRDPELRKARVCYDHLAGDFGVEIYDAFVAQKFIKLTETNDEAAEVLGLTAKGRKFCEDLGIDYQATSKSRRPLCRPCLDWSARRYHIAGFLGVGILNFCYQKNWARRIEGSRVVKFNPRGERALHDAFHLRNL